MDTELSRLASFVDFPPKSSAIACRLARSGFYYGGHGDAVVCNECQLELGGWTTVDELFQQHCQKSAGCQLSQLASLSLTVPRNTDYGPFLHIESDDNAPHPETLCSDSAYSPRDTIDRSNPDFDQLRSEAVRLGTFYDWPSRAARVVDPGDLAEAGLFYTGHQDRVQCAFCRGFLRNWILGDRPADEHRKHFPDCPFVRGLNVGNVRYADPSVISTTTRAPYKTSAVDAMAIVNLTETAPEARGPAAGSRGLHVRHPEFVDVARRIQSYRGKRVGNGQTVEGLANAGFFHVGPDDDVCCFHCDGVLKNWQPADDPWTDHARWFPRCPFLVANTDREFIVRNEVPNNASHQTTNHVASPDGQFICASCRLNHISKVFLPCGHGSCDACNPFIVPVRCHVCRHYVVGCVQLNR